LRYVRRSSREKGRLLKETRLADGNREREREGGEMERKKKGRGREGDGLP
jgi:hypothetical protein